MQARRLFHRRVEPLVHQRLQHMATEAPGGCDDALGVALQQLPIEARLVVVPLHVGATGQLDEVLVAGVVLGDEGEVVVELGAGVGVTPGIVDPAPPGRALVATVVGHVGLEADDRLHVSLATLPIEIQNAVHVAVIGDAQRRLAIGGRRGDELAEASSTVEHRELGVDMQVGERRRHCSNGLPVDSDVVHRLWTNDKRVVWNLAGPLARRHPQFASRAGP